MLQQYYSNDKEKIGEKSKDKKIALDVSLFRAHRIIKTVILGLQSKLWFFTCNKAINA